MVYRLLQRGDNIHILKEGKEIKVIKLLDDLQYCLHLLETLNTLKDKKGKFLYESRMIERYSVWSFGQQFIFWSEIRPFVKFKPVLQFIIENNFLLDECLIDHKYIEILSHAKLCKTKKYYIKPLVLIVFHWFTKIAARIISEITFLKMRLVKIETLVYTPDKFSNTKFDFRFSRVYSYLIDNNIPFVEIFHSTLDKEFVLNIFKRHRLAIYIEALKQRCEIENLAEEFDLSELDSTETIMARKIINNFSIWSIESIQLERSLRNKFRKTQIKRLISMDDPRNTNELIIALSRLGIKSFGIQHGHFTKYLVGWMNPKIPRDKSVTFDKLFVWNNYWKKVLTDYSSQYNESNVEVGGLLRPPRYLKLKSKPFPHSLDKLRLLIPIEPLAPQQLIGDFINDLQKKGVTFYQAVRPDTKGNPLSAYHLDDPDKIKIVKGIDENLLNSIDAVAGTYSTFLNEMIYYDKPIIIFDTCFEHGHRLVEDELALKIKRNEYNKIIPYIVNHKSKKDIVWPSSPSIETTLGQIINRKS